MTFAVGWAICLTCGHEQSRTVTMSEELMQQFAVTDRAIPLWTSSTRTKLSQVLSRGVSG